MRHVVFLVGRYYPLFSAPGECAKKLIDGIRDEWKVSVIATRTHDLGGPPQVEQDGVTVHFVSNWRNDLRVLVTDWKQGRRRRWALLLEPVVRVLNALATMFLFPSRDAWYKRAGYRELTRLYQVQPFDVLVSVSFPFCAHWAAYRFSRCHPEVKWVTYSVDTLFRNPGTLTYCAYKAVKPMLCQRIETKVLSAAGHNFVSAEIGAKCVDLLASISAPTTVLQYMIPDRAVSSEGTRRLPLGKCNVVYGGALYRNIRSPEHLLNVCERLSDVDIGLHLFVRSGDCADLLKASKRRMGDRIQLHELVPPAEFKQLIQEADILINLENNLPNFFPSKVFDYISSGRPLVTFKYHELPLSPILAKYPCLLQLDNSGEVQQDAASFEAFCRKNRGHQVTEEDVRRCFPEHTASHVIQDFKGVLSARR